MKTLIIKFAFITIFAIAPVWAGHTEHSHDHAEHGHNNVSAEKPVTGTEGASCKDITNIKVNGLVCDFCARAIEKVFSKRDEVASINVDLDNGFVHVVMRSGKTIDDDTLTQLITDSGYNVTSIENQC
ncbi:MAG: heavy metal-associated domain-containing protein [Parvularculales bacterium]